MTKILPLPSNNKNKMSKKWLFALLIFIWPLIYLFPYLIPNQPFSLSISNDFYSVYYVYKAYLLDVLSNFRMPLWSPSEACGYPFYSSPLAQPCYPLNILLVIVYKLFHGYPPFFHQVFTVFGVSIFALGLYLWLRSLKIDVRPAFISAAIMSTDMKIIEIFRFPNGVHSIAWIPFILLGITIALNRYIKGFLIIILSTLMLVTAAYPYYTYYSIFLIGPYILLLLFNKTRKELGYTEPVNLKRYLCVLFASFLSTITILLPYLWEIKELLSQTTNRYGKSFAWSTEGVFSLSDTLGSLFFPPAAQTEGWYYFGMVSVFLIIIFVISFVSKTNRSKSNIIFLSIIFIWFLTITYISYGKGSYLFKLLWYHLPGFSSLRMWGRLSIILLPIISLLLARAYSFFEALILNDGSTKSRHIEFRPFLLKFFIVYLIILAIQYYFYHNKLFDDYWTTYFLAYNFVPQNFDESFYIVMGAISFGVIIFLLVFARKIKFVESKRKRQNIHKGFMVSRNKMATAIMMLLLLLNSYDVRKVGISQWAHHGTHDYKPTTLNIDEENMKSFSCLRYDIGTISLNKFFFVGGMANWHYERYINFKDRYEKEEKDYLKQLLGLNDGRRFYFSKNIEYQSIKDFLTDAISHEKSSNFRSQVIKYNGDRLEMVSENSEEGYLSFIDNWDPEWEAKVNGKEIQIEKLFGTFKSVKIKPGTNNIQFSYKPKFFSFNVKKNINK
ncbi:MAG: YfhO family protein [bacterium]|nr:YfhO family protein [bacterium]